MTARRPPPRTRDGRPWPPLALVAVTAVAVAAIAAGAALLLGGAGGGAARKPGAGARVGAAAAARAADDPRHGARAKLKLDPRARLPDRAPATPVRVAGGLTIAGGRNVVVRGGQVVVPWQGARPASGSTRRGLFLTAQTGTVHVEGLRLSGDLGDGIDLDERLGATVQLENIRVDR